MRDSVEISRLIRRLRAFHFLPTTIRNLEEQLEAAKAEALSIKAISFDSIGRGTPGDPHSRIEYAVTKCDSLEARIQAARLEQSLMTRALASLPPNERRVLEVSCVQWRRGAGIVDLQAELGYSEPQVYRIRRRALENLYSRLYGRFL